MEEKKEEGPVLNECTRELKKWCVVWKKEEDDEAEDVWEWWEEEEKGEVVAPTPVIEPVRAANRDTSNWRLDVGSLSTV